MASHWTGSTFQVEGATGEQAKFLASRGDLGFEAGWHHSDQRRAIQGHGVPVDAMTTTGDQRLAPVLVARSV
jgi:hypothetical protein